MPWMGGRPALQGQQKETNQVFSVECWQQKGDLEMAKRKAQFRKQQIATVGHSDKGSRRMHKLAAKIELARAKEQASQGN